MSTVYHVTEKGLIELGSRRPSLPAEIREILKLVDGRRSSSELIAVLGRSATVACPGGFRQGQGRYFRFGSQGGGRWRSGRDGRPDG
jgi:hypothetical protein